MKSFLRLKQKIRASFKAVCLVPTRSLGCDADSLGNLRSCPRFSGSGTLWQRWRQRSGKTFMRTFAKLKLSHGARVRKCGHLVYREVILNEYTKILAAFFVCTFLGGFTVRSIMGYQEFQRARGDPVSMWDNEIIKLFKSRTRSEEDTGTNTGSSSND